MLFKQSLMRQRAVCLSSLCGHLYQIRDSSDLFHRVVCQLEDILGHLNEAQIL